MQKKLTYIALLLTFFVILLGAYTRLKDAGLGCPDWPGCYGQLLVPSSQSELAYAEQIYPGQPVEQEKAWIEMIHRYVAGSLGLLIFFLFFQSIYQSRQTKISNQRTPFLPFFLLMIALFFQATLGMWTVTLKLYPVVVMGHLMGGLTIFALLTWAAMSFKFSQIPSHNQDSTGIKIISLLAVTLLFLQLALGGWTSANYAALSCPDFPTCQNQWLPDLNWQAFNIFNVGFIDSPGQPLDHTGRVTIHFIHRVGAIIASLVILVSIFLFYKHKLHQTINGLGLFMPITLILLLAQVCLGISNIIFHWPLSVAVLHNGIGALLLAALVSVNYLIYRQPRALCTGN